MKKFISIIVLAIMLMTTSLWAAGSCTQKMTNYSGGAVLVKFVCTGSATDGSIPNTAISSETMGSLVGKYYLYSVTTYPTSGGTAPDAADVTVLQNGEDLLGGKGVNLINSSATYTTFPYSTFMSMYRFQAVVNTLTLTVANQGTNSANYTIELVFVR
jgi:hypothetical protein